MVGSIILQLVYAYSGKLELRDSQKVNAFFDEEKPKFVFLSDS
jgi:hypothetical protein